LIGKVIWCIVVFFLSVAPDLVLGPQKAQAQRLGSSPFSPAPAGTPVQTIIECGSGYISHELYDARITLLEIVRGAEAWDLLAQAAPTNEPPKAGVEYVLARIKFEYSARGLPGDCNHELKEEQFVALSPEGNVYKMAALIPPNPRLNGMLHSGGFLEGWVAFAIPHREDKALMTFAVKVGGAVEHGGNIWFRLY
jgi:hypothetical protein